MRKSLLLAPDFPPSVGGIQNYLYEIVKRLPSDKVVVLADKHTQAKEFDTAQNFQTYRARFLTNLPIRPGWSPLFLRTLRLVQKERIKLIQCGKALHAGIIAYLIRKLIRTPYIVYTYAMELNQWYGKPKTRWWLRRVLDNAEKVVTISEYTKELLQTMGVPSDKIVMAYPGVDTTKFRPNIHGKKVRAKYGIRKSKILLTVSRLGKRKGHETVIQALKDIKKEIPNIHYLIVGKGEHQKALEDLVEKEGLKDNVTFAGFVSEGSLPEYYAASDLFIMPSRVIGADVEGFGIVYLEANATGKAVIAGTGGGVADAVVDGETGLCVDAEDAKAISEAVIRLLTDDDLRVEMGKNGRDRVERTFNWKATAESVKKVL